MEVKKCFTGEKHKRLVCLIVENKHNSFLMCCIVWSIVCTPGLCCQRLLVCSFLHLVNVEDMFSFLSILNVPSLWFRHSPTFAQDNVVLILQVFCDKESHVWFMFTITIVNCHCTMAFIIYFFSV